MLTLLLYHPAGPFKRLIDTVLSISSFGMQFCAIVWKREEFDVNFTNRKRRQRSRKENKTAPFCMVDAACTSQLGFTNHRLTQNGPKFRQVWEWTRQKKQDKKRKHHTGSRLRDNQNSEGEREGKKRFRRILLFINSHKQLDSPQVFALDRK